MGIGRGRLREPGDLGEKPGTDGADASVVLGRPCSAAPMATTLDCGRATAARDRPTRLTRGLLATEHPNHPHPVTHAATRATAGGNPIGTNTAHISGVMLSSGRGEPSSPRAALELGEVLDQLDQVARRPAMIQSAH
jgi:hypothetical protein